MSTVIEDTAAYLLYTMEPSHICRCIQPDPALLRIGLDAAKMCQIKDGPVRTEQLASCRVRGCQNDYLT